ncbi:MAG: SRPBCC domain-containing protein [Sphingomonas sp.]
MPAPAIHDTFTLERRYPHSAEKLFRVLTEQPLRERWYSAGRNSFERFETDFRVGGHDHHIYRLGADTPFPGAEIVNDGRFEDILPGERFVLATTTIFAGKRISSALITHEIASDGAGCLLRLTHQAVFYEGADGPEMRRGGWDTLLDSLAGELDA